MQDTKRASNPISISVAPTTRAIGKRYFDLPGTIELMSLLWQEVDFEAVSNEAGIVVIS